MAYYLSNEPSSATKFIAISTQAATTDAGRPLQVEWEVEFEAARMSTDLPIAATSATVATTLLFLRTGTDFEFRTSGSTNWIVTTGVDLTNFNKFLLRTTFDGTTRFQTLHINDVLVASRNPGNSGIGALGALFPLSNSTRFGGLKYFKFTDFVTPANNRHWDANASGGVGNVLPETLAGANGTQQGTWPANDSEWVFYDAGGATTADISYDIGGIEFSVSASSLAPSLEVVVNYDIGEVSFLSQLISNAPEFQSELFYDVGQIDFSVSIGSLAPVAELSVNYDIGLIDWIVSANSAVSGNAAYVAYDIGEIFYDASLGALPPDAMASIIYDIGDVTYSAFAQILPPPAQAAVLYDIGSVDLSIVANSGAAPSNIPVTISYDIGAISYNAAIISGSIDNLFGVGFGVEFSEPISGVLFSEPLSGIKFKG